MDFYTIFSEYISKIIIVTLVYLILYRAFDNFRYRIKGIIILSISIVLALIFGVALIYDVNNGVNTKIVYYKIYIATNLIYGIGFFIYYFTRFSPNHFRNRKVKVTSKVYYKEFLYLVLEYKGEYLLVKGKETYSGLILPVKRTKFYDDFISDFLKKNHIEAANITKFGKYTITEKKEEYYCFLINLHSEIKLKHFESIHISKIRFLPMNDFNKKIIYRILINEKIDIEE